MKKQPNIVLVVSDTLRKDYLGCYGNTWVKTPNIDAFSREATIFTNAYPESLPTIPVRRALHTGRRVFPFNDYRPLKWDIVYLPGWQAISNDEDTVAENLVAHGYHTGFCTDTLPYFAPGFNFTRGFWQWHFARGQQQDRKGSVWTVGEQEVERYYGTPRAILENRYKDITAWHVANTRGNTSGDDTTTAEVFRWGINFIHDNIDGQPFYLFLDCFDPHEPWEAPSEFLDLYKDPGYAGKILLHPAYGPNNGKYSDNLITNTRAHFAGLVSLVDHWFGKVVEALKKQEIYEDTLIIFTSDHGTNHGDNPRQVMGKPSFFLNPAVMDLPLLIHFPGNETEKEQERDGFVYNTDIPATIYAAASIDARQLGIKIHGQDLASKATWNPREYLTSRYGNNLWYRDARWWLMFSENGIPTMAYDLEIDPTCQYDIVVDMEESVADLAWERILNDAGGSIPVYQGKKQTDAIGR